MPTEYSVDKEDLDLTHDQGHPFHHVILSKSVEVMIIVVMFIEYSRL